MINRKRLLEKLLALDESPSKISDALGQFGWDSKVDLAILKRTDIVSALKRYLESKLTASDIEQWANAIEGREDIGYESENETLIRQTIFVLANPTLTESLNFQTAKQWINQLI